MYFRHMPFHLDSLLNRAQALCWFWALLKAFWLNNISGLGMRLDILPFWSQKTDAPMESPFRISWIKYHRIYSIFSYKVLELVCIPLSGDSTIARLFRKNSEMEKIQKSIEKHNYCGMVEMMPNGSYCFMEYILKNISFGPLKAHNSHFIWMK